VAQLSGAKITLDYERSYPVLVNHPAETGIAARVASDIVGVGNVSSEIPPVMGAEDFATCSKHGLVLLSLSAMAIAPDCITLLITSMTMHHLRLVLLDQTGRNPASGLKGSGTIIFTSRCGGNVP
jgi:metal-dependent amidase/aminoacylase/carboxypeptidase family protein